MDTIGKRIAAARKAKGIKQDELAEKLLVSPQAVSKWENDISCPDISVLPGLSKILGTSIDELLCGKQEPAVSYVPEEKRKDINDMMFRIMVDSSEGDKVRVNLPCALVKIAIECGMEMPEISGVNGLKGIDIAKVFDKISYYLPKMLGQL